MRNLIIAAIIAISAAGCSGNNKYSDTFIPISAANSRMDLTEVPLEFQSLNFRAKASANYYYEIVSGVGGTQTEAKLEYYTLQSSKVLNSKPSTRKFDEYYDSFSNRFGRSPQKSDYYELESNFGTGYFRTTVSSKNTCAMIVLWGTRNLKDDDGRPGAIMLGYICRQPDQPFENDEIKRIVKSIKVTQIVYDGKGILSQKPTE